MRKTTRAPDRRLARALRWLLTVLLGMVLGACAGSRPDNLGVTSGRLAPCPSRPNCVSSQSSDPDHWIRPLSYQTSPGESLARLREIILAMPRTRIIEEGPDYLYVEFTSNLMGFVDDGEFYVDNADKVIHVRSASRLGYSDLGVNRKRIESIRAEFEAPMSTPST